MSRKKSVELAEKEVEKQSAPSVSSTPKSKLQLEIEALKAKRAKNAEREKGKTNEVSSSGEEGEPRGA